MSSPNQDADSPRIAREKKTIEAMVQLYCSDHHPGTGRLCTDCEKLLAYAKRRLDSCPFQQAKPACNHCLVHCYAPKMRDSVKQVMRYSGPRMLLRHPMLSLLHLLDKFRKVPTLQEVRRR